MGMNAALVLYQTRITELQASTSQLRSHQLIAFTIMGMAIIAALLLAFFSLARHTLRLPSALLPLPIAFYYGRQGKQYNSALLKSLRILDSYKHGVTRMEGSWAGSGFSGSEFLRSGHPYDKDLHLFGEGSLFELLCTCRTGVGRRQLAECLVTVPKIDEILERQTAVQELRERTDLREQLVSLGEFSFQDSNWKTITEWLASPIQCGCLPLRVFACITSICLAALALLGWDSVLPWSAVVIWIILITALHAALGLLHRTKVISSLQAIHSVGAEIGILRQGLRFFQAQEFTSPLLTRLVASARQHDAPAKLRKLERLINVLRHRDKEWFYIPSRILLVGTQAFWAIEEWRFRYGTALLNWLSIWGEFEALMALACYAYEHPENTFPSFLEQSAALDAEDVGHPLLPIAGCIRNDISLNQQSTFYVISGSNMSGKSTLMRAIGLNTILAYTGAPVCATAMCLSLFAICASFSIQDSLLEGKSRFLAEVNRLKQALTLPLNHNPVLFLIDEILSGTNSKDRRLAAEAIIRALVQRGAMGLLSTHDLALTELADLPDLQGVNVHMGSGNSSDPMNFDYKLKPGPTRESNALAIARLAGVSV